jgi:AcrR family transcriptional regulator
VQAISDTQPAPRPPIVQARARRTREKILAQAKRAFSERGFEATNLTEHILTPAGVSVGSFYHQFTNKREVLLEIFDHAISARHERIRDHIRHMQTDTFGDAVRVVIDLLLDDVETDPDIWHVQWREHESPDPEIRQRALVGVGGWTDVVLRMMEPFYPGDLPNKTLVAETSVVLASGLVREFSHLTPDDQHRRRHELVDTFVAYIQAATDALLRPA